MKVVVRTIGCTGTTTARPVCAGSSCMEAVKEMKTALSLGKNVKTSVVMHKVRFIIINCFLEHYTV